MNVLPRLRRGLYDRSANGLTGTCIFAALHFDDNQKSDARFGAIETG